MSNFDLRKYLAEGRLLKEYDNSRPYPQDYYMDDNDPYNDPYNPFMQGRGKIAITKDEKNTVLLDFIKQNQREVAKQVGAIRLEDIMIDDSRDVGATGIYNNGGDEMEGGLAFRFPEDVDDRFKGEEGDKPKPITVAAIKLMYIGYNI